MSATDIGTAGAGPRGARTEPPSPHAAFAPGAAPAAPSSRLLTLVELRKMTDTRSGRWVLAVIGLTMVGLTCLVVFAGDAGDRTSADIFLASQTGLSLLLPVVAIVAVTAEWSQRDGLTTFALVPARERVVRAKAQAGLVLAVCGIGVSALVTVGGHALGLATGNADGGWSIPLGLVATRVLDCAIAVFAGLAFGMLLGNPTLSILGFYAVPLVLGILGDTVSALDATMTWIDPGRALTPLSEEGGITGAEWAHLTTSTALFTALPFAGGLVRTLRREML
ncbi:ABC transporter permease [Yinghuangia sp. ASG 101]|uniref:ABC transporter permease n=1 Tax=Yinghuangia sp. ASG 101 TaxID=2896848 RepID=UPI001E5BEADD|nr:ABC transporter permease [Yinghuangia sp. ASG 101]UGQ10332.1 ABC transporter permease [Yinghuangia sp. ASG 101]